jgi:hypothetical protein
MITTLAGPPGAIWLAGEKPARFADKRACRRPLSNPTLRSHGTDRLLDTSQKDPAATVKNLLTVAANFLTIEC